MSPYASNKILHHLAVVEDLRNHRQPAPVHVQLVISDLCNQDCSFCAYRLSGYTTNQLFSVTDEAGIINHNPNRMIPWAKLEEIIDDCSRMGVKAIQVTGGGEPTVHPNCRQLLDTIANARMDYSLVTNGLRWNDGLTQSVMGATWLRFSLDAGTPETYSRIRRTDRSNFAKVLGHIQSVVEARARCGSEVHIGVGFVVTADNWEEVLTAALAAKTIGVDSFRISGMFQQDGAAYFDAFRDEAATLCEDARATANKRFQVIDMFGNRVSDLEQGSPDYPTCYYQHVTTYIGADLNVYRCCNTAYNERGLVGSIKDQSFSSLWASEEKQTAYQEFDARGCERCQFNDKNRAIAGLVEPQMAHPNFV